MPKYRPAKIDADSLTPRQHTAIACLLKARTQKEAAEMAEVPARTIQYWLAHDMAFRTALNEGKKAVIEEAIADIGQASVDAVDVLKELMGDRSAPASSRVTAARAILDYAVGKNAEADSRKDDVMGLLADLVEKPVA